jgi:hypothetical protein
MPGHLFVVRGDLTRIACDAWLLPTSWALWIEDYWLAGTSKRLSLSPKRISFFDETRQRQRDVSIFSDQVKTPESWGTKNGRTFEWEDWKSTVKEPRPWLTDMADGGGRKSVKGQAEWFAEGARQFVEAAAAKLHALPAENRPASSNRLRPLLALPVVGTGAGGGSREAGTIIERLVTELLLTLEHLDVDVVIVTHTADQFAAVQHARREIESRGIANPWIGLSCRLKKEGDVLADHAKAGQLVLFLGAGVSVGAGLPT